MAEAKKQQEQQKAREDDIDLSDGMEDEDDISATVRDMAYFHQQYAVDGKPHFSKYHAEPRVSTEDLASQTVENDYYLHDRSNNPLFANGRKHLIKPFAGYTKVSAYDTKKRVHTDLVERSWPTHGQTDGGKGLTTLSRPVISHHAGFSSLVNVVTSFGCSASCSFCKESYLARSFTQVDINELTGLIRIHPDEDRFPELEPFTIPGKVRVKFWDSINNIMSYGPLQVALVNKFPIEDASFIKVATNESYRLLSD